MYSVISIFGVDAVEIKLFDSEPLARASLKDRLNMCSEDNNWDFEKKDCAEYYIVNKTEEDPTAYIEFVLQKVNY